MCRNFNRESGIEITSLLIVVDMFNAMTYRNVIHVEHSGTHAYTR